MEELIKQVTERTGISHEQAQTAVATVLGFTIYSWLVSNWVFVVTNSLMLVNGLLGLLIVLHHRRRERRAAAGD